MKLTTIVPHPSIAPFIHHFWVFEAPAGIPATDARIVVPNGRPKLIVPWRNGLDAGNERYGRATRESEVVFIGVWDEPTTLSSSVAPTTTIGIEFKPSGLARFLRGDMSDIFSSIAPADALLGKAGRRLRERLSSAASLGEAVRLTHHFLLESFRRESDRADLLANAAVHLMWQNNFRLNIEEIADRLGCSRRHLQTIFNQRIGIAPKRLQGILAFEELYRAFARDGNVSRLNEDALDHFYDQPHFIRNFRHFTGYSPTKYAELSNEFGAIFYRQSTV
ncbi:helix-turn-helix domain-containing protein [Rhizobium sp. C4]|uniref:helix-turn-helix domain-containing protein n=1 Tax=Rhizobium sp. C4 TaxID=1349800 RepID=UPI001E505384|nr:helix-turn-helix domain-containing protein [Rhizobium sp. C4]MCD2171699.1 helix-turn-helix domain-containing protein [Rhizobium sp. C4]